MRSFTANFTAQAALKQSAPYLILEIDWGGTVGTKYYTDRPAIDDSYFITADGKRFPGDGGTSLVDAPKVLKWPQIALALKEGAVGAVEQASVTLDDTSGALTAILNGDVYQRVIVAVWRLFDDPTTVWPTDAALMFSGSLLPFDWTIKDNRVTLNLGDASRLLQRDISCIANSTTFPPRGVYPYEACPPESQDKNIPLGWGTAQRVEAVLIQRTFVTTTTTAIDGSTNTPTVGIADDPTAFGIPLGPGPGIGTTAIVMIGTQTLYAYFQSDGMGGFEMVITAADYNPIVATATVLYNHNAGGGGQSFPVFPDLTVCPQGLQTTLATAVAAMGVPSVIVTLRNTSDPANAPNGVYYCGVQTLTYNAPWPNYYKLLISSANPYLQNNVSSGDLLAFYDATAQTITISPWPAGTRVEMTVYSASPAFATPPKWVYAFNALPAKGVLSVWGFGTVTDQAGNTRKDFVLLGQSVQQVKSGTVVITSESFDWFTVNLNDSTWFSTLGRNIATITFPGSPRATANQLDDDRIWVTFQGVEDKGDSTGNLITNPATVILQYLENTHLMNVNTGSIDAASFAAAASALAGYSVGFAQIEAQRGLELLHDIARQCHAVLFFDQGQAKVKVLANSYPGSSVLSFDTTAGGQNNILLGSLDVSESSVDDVVNQVNFKWRAFWDDKRGNNPFDSKNVDLTSVAAFTLQSREIPIYIYWRRADVATERDFWLSRWTTIWRLVKFTTFHQGLALQAGDWITVTAADASGRSWSSAVKMVVTKTVDLANGQVTVEAKYPFKTY
jgi:hypothetical protein